MRAGACFLSGWLPGTGLCFVPLCPIVMSLPHRTQGGQARNCLLPSQFSLSVGDPQELPLNGPAQQREARAGCGVPRESQERASSAGYPAAPGSAAVVGPKSSLASSKEIWDRARPDMTSSQIPVGNPECKSKWAGPQTPYLISDGPHPGGPALGSQLASHMTTGADVVDSTLPSLPSVHPSPPLPLPQHLSAHRPRVGLLGFLRGNPSQDLCLRGPNTHGGRASGPASGRKH